MAASILLSGGRPSRSRRLAMQAGRLLRGSLTWAERLAWTAFFLFALTVIALRYAVLPRVETYRPDIESALTRATGLKVTIGAVKAGWEGLRPDLDLLDVQIHDKQGRRALSLPFVSITLSWRSVLFGQLRLHKLEIAKADLDIRRSRDGRFSIGGIELKHSSGDERMSDWILGQSRIVIRESRLRWNDELRAAPELALADIHLIANNNGDRHRIALRGTPPRDLARTLDLRADFYGASLANLRPWRGEVYADLASVDLAAWRAWVDYPVDIRSGVGSLRTWAGFDTERLTHFTADIALNKALVRLRKDLAPLELSNVQGRIGARELLHPGTGFSFLRFGSRHVTGFEVSGKQVALTTNAGVRLAPADFVMQTIAPGTVAASGTASGGTSGGASAGASVDTAAAGAAAGTAGGAATTGIPAGAPGEIRLQANALNLEPLVKIAELLPLDVQLRKLLVDLDPRGTLHDFSLEWKGDFDAPAGYRVRGRFADLALNAYTSVPGFSGLSGTLDATEKSGTLQLASKGSAVLLPQVFEEPRLEFDTLDVKSTWSFPAGRLELKIEQAAFANADLAGQFSTTYRSVPDSPGYMELAGRLTRSAADRVYRYMPAALSPGLHAWVKGAIEGGHSSDVRFKLRGNLYDFPFTDPKQGEFQVAAKVEDGRLFYADAWPRANNIKGDLLFERSGMSFKSRAAGTILGAKIGALDLKIANFEAAPSLLELTGNAEGPATEFLKFIDHSPVTGYVEGFTTPMRASGQGRLTLSMALPLVPMSPPPAANAVARTAAAPAAGTAAKAGAGSGAGSGAGKSAITSAVTSAKPPATPATLRVNGQYQFINTDILLDTGLPKMERVNGALAFTERGFELRNIRGDGVGGAFTVAGGSRANNTIGVTAQGNFTVPGVAAWLKDPVFASMSGGSLWRANINIDARGGEVAVESTLAGVAIDLPIPLSKPVAEAWPMRFVKTPGAAAGEEEWNLSIGKALVARLLRREEGGVMRVVRAAAGINDAMPALPRTGFAVNAAATLIDVDDWRQRAFGVRGGTGGAGRTAGAAGTTGATGATAATAAPAAAVAAAASIASLPAPWQLQVRADTLTAFGRPLHQVRVYLVQEPARWAANLTSNEANGTLSFRPATLTAQGRFEARMKNLLIPASAARSDETPFDRIAEDMPAVDLAVEDFQIGDKKLGRLEFDATNIASEWRIQTLNLTNPDGTLSASGAWRRPVRAAAAGAAPGAPAIMRRPIHLDFTLNTPDSGKLLDRLGFPNTVRAGSGYLKGNAGWDGSPMAIDYASLRGDLELHIEKGQFLKADPGAGKLLGIMSLQALPRRLALDFRDVFSEGFAFDLASASSKIERGVLTTNDFRMTGVSAVVLMTGDTDLARETQNLKVVVLPDLSGGMVSAIGVLTGVINPLGALVSFLAQRVLKDPISKAFSFEYAVTGSWADPTIARIQTLPQGQAAETQGPPPVVPVVPAVRTAPTPTTPAAPQAPPAPVTPAAPAVPATPAAGATPEPSPGG